MMMTSQSLCTSFAVVSEFLLKELLGGCWLPQDPLSRPIDTLFGRPLWQKKQSAVLDEPRHELPPAQPSAVDAVAAHDRQIHKAKKQVLMELASGVPASADKNSVLAQAGIDGKYAIEMAIGRTRNALEMLADFGTLHELSQTEEELSAAESRRDENLPAVRERLAAAIAELQRQADELNGPVERLTAVVARKKDILKILRSPATLPEYERNQYESMRSQIRGRFRPLFDAQSVVDNRTAQLAIISEIEPLAGHPDRIRKDELRGFCNRNDLWRIDARFGTVVDAAKLARLKSKFERERSEAQMIILAAGTDYQDAVAECEKALDYWLN